MSAEGTTLVGGSGGILPQKMFKFGGYETLFSALIMRCVSEKLTLNKCERGRGFKCIQVLISEVLLIWNTTYIQALVH